MGVGPSQVLDNKRHVDKKRALNMAIMAFLDLK